MLEGDLQRVGEERLRGLRTATEGGDHAVGVEGLGDDLRQEQGLRQGDPELEQLGGAVDVAVEEVQASEMRGERCHVGVRLVGGEDGECRFHALDRLVETPSRPLHFAEPRRDPSGRMHLARGLEQLERAPVMRFGRLGAHAERGHLACTLAELCLRKGIVGKLDGVLEVTLRLLEGHE